jgi:hypothetical protein
LNERRENVFFFFAFDPDVTLISLFFRLPSLSASVTFFSSTHTSKMNPDEAAAALAAFEARVDPRDAAQAEVCRVSSPGGGCLKKSALFSTPQHPPSSFYSPSAPPPRP